MFLVLVLTLAVVLYYFMSHHVYDLKNKSALVVPPSKAVDAFDPYFKWRIVKPVIQSKRVVDPVYGTKNIIQLDNDCINELIKRGVRPFRFDMGASYPPTMPNCIELKIRYRSK